jgi:polysaccharide deacetylase 2 family uncharacterized protein YibQ
VTTDDLSAPLGQNKTRRRRGTLSIPWPPVVVALLALPIVVFGAVAVLSSDPFGGEPMATAPATMSADAAAAADGPATPTNTRTVTIIDGSNGSRREVTIPAPSDAPAAATSERAAGEARLLEQSRHGPLPKIAADGTRPADAYAQPTQTAAGNTNGPRIAIIVGGLGIGANTTADALRKLPGAVTFAFSPYGSDLERQVARARASGHEVMLQVPMEPFDYPDNDPGPHTLLTSVDAGQNLDRLHWLMSRFQGYVGLVNTMGGRFSASEQAMAPVLRDAAARGLIYADDGSSARSLASQIAGANNLPFAKADIVIDQVSTAADIDKALGRLETLARSRGTAVGFAGALPVSIERIARWAKAAEKRGIQLVPITAAAARAKSS